MGYETGRPKVSSCWPYQPLWWLCILCKSRVEGRAKKKKKLGFVLDYTTMSYWLQPGSSSSKATFSFGSEWILAAGLTVPLFFMSLSGLGVLGRLFFSFLISILFAGWLRRPADSALLSTQLASGREKGGPAHTGRGRHPIEILLSFDDDDDDRRGVASLLLFPYEPGRRSFALQQSTRRRARRDTNYKKKVKNKNTRLSVLTAQSLYLPSSLALWTSVVKDWWAFISSRVGAGIESSKRGKRDSRASLPSFSFCIIMKRDIENGAKAESNQIKRIPLYCQIQTGPQPDKEKKAFHSQLGWQDFGCLVERSLVQCFSHLGRLLFHRIIDRLLFEFLPLPLVDEGRKEINKRKAQGFTLGDVKYYPVPPPWPGAQGSAPVWPSIKDLIHVPPDHQSTWRSVWLSGWETLPMFDVYLTIELDYLESRSGSSESSALFLTIVLIRHCRHGWRQSIFPCRSVWPHL